MATAPVQLRVDGHEPGTQPDREIGARLRVAQGEPTRRTDEGRAAPVPRRLLERAATQQSLAASSAHAWSSRPECPGCPGLLVLVGWEVQWPTIRTLPMRLVRALTYARHAGSEEREVAAQYREDWKAYAVPVPTSMPHRPVVAAAPAGAIADTEAGHVRE